MTRHAWDVIIGITSVVVLILVVGFSVYAIGSLLFGN